MVAPADMTFREDEITVNGKSWRVPYQISDARLFRDGVVVLYDHVAGPRYHFANLEAFDLQGRKLWSAEAPTHDSSEAYVQLDGTEPLVATSFTAFRCTLDPATGKILDREFTK